MRKIISLAPIDGFQLLVRFDNDIQKKVDLKPYLDKPVFSVFTNNEELFRTVINKGYFIEWPSLEIDLSADTLWHEGK